MNKVLAVAGTTVIGLGLAFLLACGGGGGEDAVGGEAGAEPAAAVAAAPALSEADAERAAQLFQSETCTVCHGELAEGVEGAGPALKGLAPYWDEERLVAYLTDPEGFRAANPDFEDRREEQYDLEMPAFDYLAEEQRRLIAAWLMTR